MTDLCIRQGLEAGEQDEGEGQQEHLRDREKELHEGQLELGNNTSLTLQKYLFVFAEY